MARIIGGIGASHAPSMEHVYDAGAEVRESDEWAPLFGPFQEVSEWLGAIKPDRLVVVYNDHMDAFFLDAYPTFALGVAEAYPIADEGFGARPFPPIAGDAALGWHIARSLVADEFDITICQELEVDHGVISPLPMVDFSEGDSDWKIPIVPLAVIGTRRVMPKGRLRTEPADVRLIAYDQRGCGRSGVPAVDQPLALSRHVDDIEEVRAALVRAGVESPVSDD